MTLYIAAQAAWLRHAYHNLPLAEKQTPRGLRLFYLAAGRADAVANTGTTTVIFLRKE